MVKLEGVPTPSSLKLFFNSKLTIMNHEQLIYTITINCPYGSLCSMIEKLSDADVEAVYGIDGLNLLHLCESEVEQRIATWTQDDWYSVSDYLNEKHTYECENRNAWRYEH